MRLCVLSCSRFDFEGLESGDDGAFDKLRSWSRSIEDLQPPSALSAPFTNSLARSARQSVLRYVLALCPLPPTLAPVQVLGNSAECSCSSLHSCFQAQLSCPLPASLSLVCPLCLLDSAQRSVLGKYITLSCAHPIWGSSSPLSSPPLWRPLHSYSHSAIPPSLSDRTCPPPALWSSPGGPAPAIMSVSLWLYTLPHQLPGDQLPHSLPAAHLPFMSSFRPFSSRPQCVHLSAVS